MVSYFSLGAAFSALLPTCSQLSSSQKGDEGRQEGWIEEKQCILEVVGRMKEELCIVGVVVPRSIDTDRQYLWRADYTYTSDCNQYLI